MGFFTFKTAGAIIVTILYCFPAVFLHAEKTYTTEFGNFSQNDPRRDLKLLNANIDRNAIQVTVDSGNNPQTFGLLNISGRVFLRKSFKLWEEEGGGDNKSSNTVASFNSSFRINIAPKNENGSTSGGLTFLIAPKMDSPPTNSSGQYLGLTNASTDGNSANQILAVEFDTGKQDFDPDDNHVGIDINSIRSVEVEPLTRHGIVLAPKNKTVFHDVWVQYDGVAKVMEIYIVMLNDKDAPTSSKPDSPVLRRENLDLREYLNQESYFGFSASVGTDQQYNCVLRWNFMIEYFPEKSDWWKIAVGVGVPVAVLGLIAATWLVYAVRKQRKIWGIQSEILEALRSLPGTPREYEFKDLKKATDNFDEKKKLGEGGYGVVYKGCLMEDNLEIAVKWFSRESIKGQGDFLAELTIINRLRHKHLVKLLGWCHRHGKLLLVYEYMPHGSLDKHLFSPTEEDPLSWEMRYKIVSCVASALHYLHNEFEQRVVHRDIKANNIMLDSDFNARLGDFGLARALDNERTSYAEAKGVLGTIGYIAPECLHTGKATQQSDIYAFGAVLLEVVCGQRPGTKIGGFQSLVDWVWYLHRDGRILDAIDKRLRDVYVVAEAERLLLLGLACSHPTTSERPRTSEVVQMISGSISIPYVPPFKPAFVWPSMVPIDIDSTIDADTTISITISQFNSGFGLHCANEDMNTKHTNSLV